MSTDGRFFELPDRDQSQVFAPSLRQAVADDPELLAFDAAVDQLDFTELDADYARVGHPAFPPRILFKIWVYGCCLGLRGSRQLDRACRRDDAFKFLAHGLRPDFRTLCRFRRRHKTHFTGLFAQTVARCQAAGLVSLAHVAIDGTKLRANRSKAGLASAQAEFRQALAEAEAADGDLPAAAEEATEEARFMKSGAELVPAYNAQLAVDADHQVIVAQQVRTEPVDQGLLAPLAQQVQANCGQVPQAVSADGGYLTEADVARLEASGTQLHLPRRAPGVPDLEWVEVEGAYRCPAGQWLRPCRVRKGQQIYRTNRCRGCPRATACGVRGQTKEVHVPLADTARGRLERRMASEAGQAMYAARKQIVEPVFGRFKHNWGWRRFLLRGKSGAQAEWSLACIGHNLRKLIQAGGLPGGAGAAGPRRTNQRPEAQRRLRVRGWPCRFASPGRPRRVAAA
jgi:transposase